MDIKELNLMIAQAAMRFSRRKRESFDEDLAQDARLAYLASRERIDPTRDESEARGYVWSTTTRAINRSLWVYGSPVSGGRHRPKLAHGGLRAVEATDGSEAPALLDAPVLPTLPPNEETPEAEVADAEWRARVRQRLEQLARADAAIALLTLLDEDATDHKVAEACGVTPRKVRRVRDNVRAACASDAHLLRLLKEKTQ